MNTALRAEWMKLRTGPALAVPLILAALLTATGAVLGDDSVDPGQLHLVGVRLGQAAVAAAGVYILAGEYGNGLIRLTFLAFPRRVDILAAKAALLTVGVIPVALLGVGAAVVTLPLDGPLLRAATACFLYLVLVGLLSLGVAAAVRSAAVAVSIVLGLLYLMPMLLQLVPDPNLRRLLYQLSPATALQALSTTVDNAELPLTPVAAVGVVAAWAVAALGLGGWLLRRRDA